MWNLWNKRISIRYIYRILSSKRKQYNRFGRKYTWFRWYSLNWKHLNGISFYKFTLIHISKLLWYSIKFNLKYISKIRKFWSNNVNSIMGIIYNNYGLSIFLSIFIFSMDYLKKILNLCWWFLNWELLNTCCWNFIELFCVKLAYNYSKWLFFKYNKWLLICLIWLSKY